MGTALIGDPDANSYYYFESERKLGDGERSEPPADVVDFVGRESR